MYAYDTPVALVGLDIGKNVHVMGSYRSDDLRELHAALTLYNNRVGFARAKDQIDQLLTEYPLVVIGSEPTGIYSEAWGRELLAVYGSAIAAGRAGYKLVNPLEVKQARLKLTQGRPRKSDVLDTKAIALCLQDGTGRAAHFPEGSGLVFVDWARRFRWLEHERRQLGGEIRRQIDRLWPGALVNARRFRAVHPDLEPPTPLVTVQPLERKLVQALLNTDPNPYTLLTLGVAGVQALLREQIGRCGVQLAQRVLGLAQQSLLPPPEVAALYAQGLHQDWQCYQTLLRQRSSLEAQAAQLVPVSPAAVLVSVPGVGTYLAARYLALVQDPDRFASAEQVWAFAGLDPLLKQSGDYRRVGQISKRGDPAARDTLFLIGKETARHCPPIRQVYLRARQRFPDRSDPRPVLHVARKANRILFHLLRAQVPYDPDRCR